MLTRLYRHFDASGRLLYVGISMNPLARLNGHRSKSWFCDITRVDIQAFKTRRAAMDAEARAIRAEKPLHNIAHVKTPEGVSKPSDTGKTVSEHLAAAEGVYMAMTESGIADLNRLLKNLAETYGGEYRPVEMYAP